jgi:hypothetical protein
MYRDRIPRTERTVRLWPPPPQMLGSREVAKSMRISWCRRCLRADAAAAWSGSMRCHTSRHVMPSRRALGACLAPALYSPPWCRSTLPTYRRRRRRHDLCVAGEHEIALPVHVPCAVVPDFQRPVLRSAGVNATTTWRAPGGRCMVRCSRASGASDARQPATGPGRVRRCRRFGGLDRLSNQGRRSKGRVALRQAPGPERLLCRDGTYSTSYLQHMDREGLRTPGCR